MKRKQSPKIKAVPFAPARTKKDCVNFLSLSSPYCTFPVTSIMNVNGFSVGFFVKEKKVRLSLHFFLHSKRRQQERENKKKKR